MGSAKPTVMRFVHGKGDVTNGKRRDRESFKAQSLCLKDVLSLAKVDVLLVLALGNLAALVL